MPEQGRGSKDQPWQGSLEKLERRRIDIAVLPLRTVPTRFEVRNLFEEDFVVAMRKGHRFARSPTLTAYSRAQHLLVSLSGDPQGFVDEFLANCADRADFHDGASPSFKLGSDRVAATPPRDRPRCPIWPNDRRTAL